MKKRGQKQSLKKMARFLLPYKRQLATVGILMVFLACFDLSLPLFNAYAIDHFIVPLQSGGLPVFALCYVGVVLLSAACTWIFVEQSTEIEMKVGRDLKRVCFVHLQRLGADYYNKTSVGYILSRVMSDTSQISAVIAWSAVDMLWAAAYSVGVLVSLFVLNATLGLFVLCALPVLVAITVFFQKRIFRVGRDVRHQNALISSGFSEGITGAVTAKTLVIEKENYQEFQTVTAAYKKKAVYSAMLSGIYTPLAVFITSITAALILRQGGIYVEFMGMPLGTLSAGLAYASGLIDPVMNLARIISEGASALVNVERVHTLLTEPELITDSEAVQAHYGTPLAPKEENYPPMRGEVEFRDVSFRYPDGDDYVLEHFNLKVPAGTTVAIVGETGAGKSTLVNLVCRFFEPTSGQLLIDGEDYRARGQNWLHHGIGYVLQTPHLLSGTILDNLRYAAEDLPDEELKRRASLVYADRVADSLPGGWNTQVGEGGELLSSGQRQIISFARAVVKNPSILILDEATSSIDTQTEALITTATREILKGRTSFVIAHRLSTIRLADLILVVQDGKIVERGTHDQLMQSEGAYYQLYTLQFRSEKRSHHEE